MQSSRTLYRFLIVFAALHLLMSGFFVASVTRSIREQEYQSIQTKLQSQARLLCSLVQEQEEADTLQAELKTAVSRMGRELSYRYVLLGPNGSLLIDSQQPEAESSFLEKSSEVGQAKESGIGFAYREDPETKQSMLSVAMQCEQAGAVGFVCVITLATEVDVIVDRIWWWLWGFAIVVGLAIGLLWMVFASTILKPLNEFSATARRIGTGAFDGDLPFRHRDDEWSELEEAFRQMQNKLSERESELKENNERMQAVLGSMIEGVLSTDASGIVLTANEAACRMLSVSNIELIDRNLLDVIRYPELRKAIDSANSAELFAESEFETTDRTRRLLKAHVSRLPNDSGEIAIVLHDVTDLRALETMRRDFVANVSHELKTPLASIKAYAETLKMGAIDDHEKNVLFVEQIESQADMLHLQIQDLIELARIESGKAASENSPVSVNDVCQKCIQQLASQAQKCRVSLEFEPDQQQPMALAEHNGIATIVTNLLSNAIHYTPAEGSVTVKTSKRNGVVVIDVVDTGIGIAPDEQLRVFERFYRVDKARSRDMGGTGLGLSIVKHLTQSYRGKVKLKSQVGKGSTFRIELPAASAG